MGKCYSLSGYLNAVVRRSTPTLLVEGPSDKGTLHRLAIELISTRPGQVTIDHSALVEDQTLTGLGAKQKVLSICTAAEALLDAHPKLAHQLGCLTDREWDGLQMSPASLINEWRAPEQQPNRFVTQGHSIENYHFDCECIIRYLRFAAAEQYSEHLETQIQQGYALAVALAGAVSFEAQSQGMLNRLRDLIGPEHIEFHDDGFHLAESFESAAQARELAGPNVFRERVNASAKGAWRELGAASHGRWLLHGHVGSDVLWACVGHMCHLCGLPSEIVRQVARGNKSERRRWWQDWLATRSPDHRIPLDSVIGWLHRLAQVEIPSAPVVVVEAR